MAISAGSSRGRVPLRWPTEQLLLSWFEELKARVLTERSVEPASHAECNTLH